MTDRMQGFVALNQAWPDKREPAERSQDFLEIHGEFIAAKAEVQAARCAQCGVPFCQTHCPLQNNIPDWLKATAEGRLEDADAEDDDFLEDDGEGVEEGEEFDDEDDDEEL